MKIAIIGAGIAGHGAALCLFRRPGFDITLFEAESRAGGHANTAEIAHAGRMIAVDTGFIVYNELNYPHLTAFLRWAGVGTVPSDMSFSLSLDGGAFEWSGQTRGALAGFFAQRANLASPRHWRLLAEILRFQKIVRQDRAAAGFGAATLGGYLARRGFSADLRDRYLAPMGGAIWSMTPGEALEFPAVSFVDFFENHKLLQFDRPVWRTVEGGSRSYVAAIGRLLGDRLKLGRRIAAIRRDGSGVEVTDAAGQSEHFDAVITATSAPIALSLLADADDEERAVLGAFRTSSNRVVLHRDPGLMPKRRAAWAAWNVLQQGGRAAVTYWMNRLQPIAPEFPLFVTLNPISEPEAGSIFGEYSYTHPIYDARVLAAQSRLAEISGRGKVHFAGAWTGYGFHEDGLRSGVEAAAALGGVPAWLDGFRQ